MTAGDLYTKVGFRTLLPTMTYLTILLSLFSLTFFPYSLLSLISLLFRSLLSLLSLPTSSSISLLFLYSILSKVMLKLESFSLFSCLSTYAFHMCEKRLIQVTQKINDLWNFFQTDIYWHFFQNSCIFSASTRNHKFVIFFLHDTWAFLQNIKNMLKMKGKQNV